MVRGVRLLLGAIVVASLATGTAGAHAAATHVATSAQVAAKVRASRRIDVLSALLVSKLSDAGLDQPERLYPSTGVIGQNRCVTVSACVFGDRAASRTVVLYGDSHAFMWLPALAPAAASAGVRLVVLWQPSCPPAHLGHYLFLASTPNPGCATWRARVVPQIVALAPALVLIGERTTQVLSEPSGRRFSTTQWARALEPALERFQRNGTRVAVLEDIPAFTAVPQFCLAAYPTEVQRRCAVPNPNGGDPGQQAAERLAARETGASLVNTVAWFCTSRCSPVVGNYLVHWDQNHVSSSYAHYLRGVMGVDLARLLGVAAPR